MTKQVLLALQAEVYPKMCGLCLFKYSIIYIDLNLFLLM